MRDQPPISDTSESGRRGDSTAGTLGAEARALAERIRELAGGDDVGNDGADRRRIAARVAGAARRALGKARRAVRGVVSRGAAADPATREPGRLRWAAASAGRRDPLPDPAEGPLFSVVVPTFDRCRDLRRALEAWERQRPNDLQFEVVVVDDGSSDDTSALLAGWNQRRFELRHDRQENRGPAAARNRALELAVAPLVLFTGDDIEPTTDLLAEHLRAHRRLADRGAAVVGRIEWPPEAELTATMRHVDGPGAQQFSFHWMEDGREYDFRHFYTSNVSVRRELLDLEPSGFSTDYPAAAFEDADLAYRLMPHGLRIVHHRTALAFHHHHYDAVGFWTRQVRCGRMAAVLRGRFPELGELIGVAAVEKLGAAVEATDAGRGAGLSAVADRVDEIEQRLAAVARGCDGLPDELAGPVLEVAFAVAYTRGIAEAVLDEDRSRIAVAAVLADRAAPALARLAERL